MTFPRYPDYKDSGVEWLGEVPEHWETCALKRVVSMKSGDTITSENIKESGDFPVFGGNGLRGYTNSYTHHGTYALIGRQGALCGNINYAKGKFWASEHAVVVSPIQPVETFWLGELLRSMNLNQYSVSAAQPGLSVEIVGNLRIPFPPATEQQKIAAFLDRETAKIDALIAEQQRLIELLKEKRQAVISHAVTKGLNPDVPMKDSGIEWLGEVPAHWKIMPLKRDLTFLTSGSRGWANHYSDEGALFIRIGNLTRNSIQIDLSDVQRVSVPDGTEGERTKIRHGDVLFSITAYLGSVAVVPENLEAAYVSQHVALARLNQQCLLPDWVAYVTLSVVGKTYLETQGYGGTKIQLSLDDVANLVMTVPDLKEQAIITHFLNRETNKLDDLTAEAQRATELLKERRTVLISAAVTGKIDVRLFALKEAA
jgi:type I restriction enzyme S subunit